jgi:hypothetical protein
VPLPTPCFRTVSFLPLAGRSAIRPRPPQGRRRATRASLWPDQIHDLLTSRRFRWKRATREASSEFLSHLFEPVVCSASHLLRCLRLDALSYQLSNQRADQFIRLRQRHRLERRFRVRAGVTGGVQTAGTLIVCGLREQSELLLGTPAASRTAAILPSLSMISKTL